MSCGQHQHRVEPRTGRWQLVQRAYDPAFREKSCVEHDGAIDCNNAVGSLVPVRRGTLKPVEHLGALEQPSHV